MCRKSPAQQEVLVSTEVKDEHTLNLERQQMMHALNDAFGEQERASWTSTTPAPPAWPTVSAIRCRARRCAFPTISCRRWRKRFSIPRLQPRSGLIQNLDDLVVGVRELLRRFCKC